MQAERRFRRRLELALGQARPRALLKLLHEFTAEARWVTTATTSRTNAAKLFAQEPSYPKGLKASEVLARLRDAERDKLIERVQFKGEDRKPRERWLTKAGLEFIGAATAATAAT